MTSSQIILCVSMKQPWGIQISCPKLSCIHLVHMFSGVCFIIFSPLADNEDNPFPNPAEEGPTIRVRDLFHGLFNHHESHSTDK